MKKIFLFIIVFMLLSFFLLFSSIYSQVKGPGLITLGQYQIVCDEFFKDDTNEDGTVDKHSYFMKGNLVLTTWDNNQDGILDSWFHYDEEEYLVLQAEDLNADGIPDEFLHFNQEEELTKRETKEEIEKKLVNKAPVLSPKPAEEPLSVEETLSYTFFSDHGQLSLRITNLELESKESGEMAWILTLTMKAETDIHLYATEY